jgi:histidyl-tRNA synthetase
LDGLVAKINSRELLQAIMDIYEIEKEKQNSFLIALDKFDKVGSEGVKEELIKRGFEPKIGEDVMNTLLDIDLLKEKLETNELGKKALGEIDQVVEWININNRNIEAVFSPFIIRGQDYYTGIIFEIYSVGVTGAAAGGGRFDNLIGMFSGEDNIPACGGSIGIDRVVNILLEQGKGIAKDNQIKILVAVWENLADDALNIASKLREGNLNVELFLGEDKIGDQLKYAVNSGCKYVVICGPDEKNKGEVVIKNLDTREQTSIGLNEISNYNFQ